MPDDATPRLPDLPRPVAPDRSDSRPESRNAGTFLALFGLGLLTFGFIAMVALILPQVRGLVLVCFGAIAFFAVHYVLWGWWLPRVMQKDDTGEGGG